MKVAEWIVERLVQLGVQQVFGVGGANIEDVFSAVQRRRPEIQAILCKHEHGAGTAADACARIGGGLGVVMVTSGGGAMNVVASLAEARASHVPVLAIVGDPPREHQGRGAFQDTSSFGLVDTLVVHRAVAVACERVARATDVPDIVERLVTAALEQRGPAVLVIAKDLQAQEVGAHLPPPPRDASRRSDMRALTTVLPLLARGPVVVIAGDEVARCGAQEALTRVVDLLDADVAVAPDARDAFDNHAPRFLGVTGAMGHDGVEAALRRAAVVVLAGTRLPLLARAGFEVTLRARPWLTLGEAAFLDSDSPESIRVVGDLRTTLERLADLLAPHARAPSPRPDDSGATASGAFGLATVCGAIDRRLERGTVVLVDAGNTGAAAVHHVRCPRGGRWLVAMGMGGMGWTYGAAIGAAVAARRRVVAITGDGAFLQHGLEVHTAVEHALPITWIILDNGAHGMCLVRERLLLGENAGYNTFREAGIAPGLAALFPGLATFACATLEDVDRALPDAFAHAGPSVVVVALPEVDVPPFAAFRPALRDGVTTVSRAP